MSLNDQIQDLFDRALSSVPDRPAPSPQILHQRLSRRRVRTRLSTLGNALTAALFPRTRHPRLYGGRLRPSLALTALTVAAVVALVTGLLIAGSKSAPAPGSSATSSVALSFRLVDVTTSPFRSLSPGATVGLQCVTDLVCYSPGASQEDFYQTTNGGLNWEQTAPLPNAADGQAWTLFSFSCPTVETCAIVYVPVGTTNNVSLAQFILTTDGGAHWTMSEIPVPTGYQNPSVGRFVCGDASHCVLSVSGDAPTAGGTSSSSPPKRIGMFLSTADAGQTWTQSTSAPSGPAAAVWTLNCDTGGSCLAVSALGSSPNSYIVGLRSDDWGLTWLAGAPSGSFDAAILYASCGDATHCMLVPAGSPTTPYEIITTSNAGATWQVSGPPAGWENMPTAVSCANANDCWIAMSTYDVHSPAGAYSQPVIEATYDGGTTWSSVALPTATPPIADVLTLSCPSSGDGCMGIGNLRDHMLPPSGPAPPSQPQSGPLVISNLPGAD
ncbi:MAG TPA: hypothetical protein VMU68_01015 [Acidimicrobiales bacterium]|nr:hypothetical protein [Acidimicrobiales bacterium]